MSAIINLITRRVSALTYNISPLTDISAIIIRAEESECAKHLEFTRQ